MAQIMKKNLDNILLIEDSLLLAFVSPIFIFGIISKHD